MEIRQFLEAWSERNNIAGYIKKIHDEEGLVLENDESSFLS